ncbi:MAG TPA: hypothetical protein VFG08_08605 [Candidatus Polarisedimenticolia bacterium]|nr:hypothetical protein [Candidatus Polarisedimenticolia bacterium]
MPICPREVLLAAALCALPAGCTPSRPAPEAVDVRQVMRAGIAASQEGDHAGFRAAFEQANRLRPGHPGILYNLACGRALTGDGEQALPLLDRLAAMGLSYDIAADDDLQALRGTPRFDALVVRFMDNGRPTVRSAIAFSLEDRDMLPEGIARDPRSGARYVGSVRGRRILRIDAQGRATPLPTSTGGPCADRSGCRLYGVMGMAVDPERRVLWAASSAVPEMEGFSDQDRGRALVARYDLDSGKLIGIIASPDDDNPHLFGDLTVHPSGDLYISDSVSPAVHLLRQGGTEIEEWIRTGEYDALQGIAFSPDGERLYVADYSRGLFAIDRESRRLSPLSHPEDVAVSGIDGLYFHDGSLIGIQNGVRPNRVVRFRLDPSRQRITAGEVLEANHPMFDDPTLGVVAEGELLYVANSQWARFSPQADRAAVESRSAPVILRLPL